MSSFLEIQDLHLSYSKEKVLNGFQLQVEANEIVALTGASGCGKTSVLRCIAGLETPQKGSIFCKEVNLLALPPEKRNVGLVFQGNALFPHMNVAQNLAFGIAHLGRKERTAAVTSMLDTLKLQGFEKRKPNALSGGQQQRVAIGRSLLTKPDLLLMDEPFSDLDQETKSHVRDEIKLLLEEHSITTIIVSHHADDVASMATKVVSMSR